MNTVVVFTAKDMARLVDQGGSGDWVLDRIRAKKSVYVVLTANAHHPESRHSASIHGSAFLIGKISNVVPKRDGEGKPTRRNIIQFSEYAELNIPDVWPGYRNPVYYEKLENLGIDPEQLDWKPFPPDISEIKTAEGNDVLQVQPLTIEQAKAGLAVALGVKPENISISINV